jgi:uncharacterized protein (TIGR03067 family)
MRTVATFALLAAPCLVGPLAAAPVPKHLMKGPEGTEAAKLQGKWRLESVLVGGRPGNLARRVAPTFEFRGDALTIDDGGRTTGKAGFDTVGGMKRITVSGMRAENKDGTLGRHEDDSGYGYILQGSTLILAATVGETGARTAADPTGLLGSNAITLVLIRVTEKK